MALSTPTTLNTTTSTGSSGSFASGSISPTGGALLIAIIGTQVGSASPSQITSVTDTLTGTGSWTVINSTQGFGCVGLAYAVAGGSPGSGAVTVNVSPNSARTVLTIVEVTGQHATPVPQNATNGGTSSTLTVTLGSTPTSTSMVLAAVNSRASTNDITEGTGFTELSETTSTGTNNTDLQVQYDLTSADTTADWSNLNTSANAGVAIEIAEASGGPTYSRSVAGDQPTATGTLSRIYQALRSLAGSQPAATGTLARILGALRSLTGSQPNATGTLAALVVYLRSLAGNQPAATGTLARTYQALRSLAGSQPTATGTLARTAGAFARSLTGSQPTATGTLSRIYQALRSLAGSQPAASGSLTASLTAALRNLLWRLRAPSAKWRPGPPEG